MAKDAVVRVQIEPELKRRAEQVFNRLGLSTMEAITLAMLAAGATGYIN